MPRVNNMILCTLKYVKRIEVKYSYHENKRKINQRKNTMTSGEETDMLIAP